MITMVMIIIRNNIYIQYIYSTYIYIYAYILIYDYIILVASSLEAAP